MTTTNSIAHRRINRRSFLGITGGSAAALMLHPTGALAHPVPRPEAYRRLAGRYSELVPDPAGVLNLPKGFQYRILSEEGSKLTSGAPVPQDHDGMAAYHGSGGTTVLVRNHELGFEDEDKVPVSGSNPYDSKQPGGTTAIVVGPDRREIKSYITSSGTRNNCAGGRTPWGTWLTCEEDRDEGHGYVYEVAPSDPENDLSKTPILAMGYFSHEAVAINPTTGIVYLTEDDFRGIIDEEDPRNDTRSSHLYRYIPTDTSRHPGALQKGGKLQALAIEEALRDADFYEQGSTFKTSWIDVSAEDPAGDALYGGAVRFNRLEGADFAGGAFWFDDTAGGESRLGQIYRYVPGTETLELFFESTDANQMESPDNLVITPWGDLWFAEDGDLENRVMGITPDGLVYPFASHRLPLPGGEPGEFSEFAGPTFSPDGKTFFVNIQSPGTTLAIWGPFDQLPGMPATGGGGMSRRRDSRSVNPARQRLMGVAAPPEGMAPRISGELAEAAARYGLSPLEAAAYHRLGVPLL